MIKLWPNFKGRPGFHSAENSKVFGLARLIELMIFPEPRLRCSYLLTPPYNLRWIEKSVR